jgi:hypothetical protein
MRMPAWPTTVSWVDLPKIDVDRALTDFVAAVTASNIDAHTRLVGFQGDFTFDQRVITFQPEPVRPAGLTANNWNVSGSILPGSGNMRTLRVSAFSLDLTPLKGEGTLFELNLRRVSKSPQSTLLRWAEPPDHFFFIDADLNTPRPIRTAPGQIDLKQ